MTDPGRSLSAARRADPHRSTEKREQALNKRQVMMRAMNDKPYEQQVDN
jgi:hypothetical protein